MSNRGALNPFFLSLIFDMEYQITDKDKEMAREIKRVLNIEDNLVFPRMEGCKNLAIKLNSIGRKDLTDFLIELRDKHGMWLSDILPEIEIDEEFEEELKQMENELKTS